MVGRLRLFLAAICWCLGGAASADEAKPPPLRTKVFIIPNPGGYGEGRDLPQFADVADVLKDEGIELPPGGEATFDRVYSVLTVRATDEVIEKVAAFLNGFALPGAAHVRAIFTVVDFETPNPVDLQQLDFEKARAAAGPSWRLVARSSLVSKFGQIATSRLASPETPLRLKRKSLGGEVQIEPMFDDKSGKAVTLSFHYQGEVEGELVATRFDVKDEVVLQPDVPLLLRTVKLQTSRGITRCRALVVEAAMCVAPASRRQKSDR